MPALPLYLRSVSTLKSGGVHAKSASGLDYVLHLPPGLVVAPAPRKAVPNNKGRPRAAEAAKIAATVKEAFALYGSDPTLTKAEVARRLGIRVGLLYDAAKGGPHARLAYLANEKRRRA